jgi:predicted N-acetyltransferase YhbS
VPTIEQRDDADDEAYRVVTGFMDQHTAEQNLVWGPEPLRLFAMEGDQIVGGLLATSSWGWLQIKVLAVCAERRDQGLGSTLMAHAEAAARTRGCHGVWLNTKGYQAPGFYERLGYERIAELETDPRERSRIFFRKHLAD